MTRRLTLAMLGVVLATLIVAGVATVTITQARSTRVTEARLAVQVRDLTASVGDLDRYFERVAAARARAAAEAGESGGAGGAGERPLSAAIRSRLLDREGCPLRPLGRALRVRDAECVLVGEDGTVTAGSAAGDTSGAGEGTPTRLDRDALAAGRVLSGSADGTAWAAAALRPATAADQDGDLPAVLLAQDVTSELVPVRRWLLLAALVALALGAGVAAWLGRRLARPLRAAEQATARLAAGDLAARLPEPAGDDELARLARSINQLAASLERSRGLERQFLLSVSHDLRTPLTSIRGYAGALQDGTLDDVARGAAVIDQEAGRLERLVRDLLDLARLDARQFHLRREPVDLAVVAAGAVDAFRPDADRAGVELVAPPGGSRLWVVGDGDRLAQVVANLVENALKFAHRRVEVAAGTTGDRVWLSVTDDGPGIDATDLPHVFERLYVAPSRPRRAESGSGLGLAIVRELVAAHGGTVAAESPAVALVGAVGLTSGGTRLVVQLPAAGPGDRPPTDVAAADGTVSAGAAAPPEPGPDPRTTPA